MPKHHEEHSSPYSCKLLFDMVSDIESYPDFLPWVTAARIIKKDGNELEAELVVKFKALTNKYTSRVILNPPAGDNEECSIDVIQSEGPFDHLDNNWKFKPDASGSKIIFDIDFSFKSKMLDMMIGGVFNKATMKMLGAFEQRARELYG